MSQDTSQPPTTPDEQPLPDCSWPRCTGPQTGKCTAWCKCRCHAARVAKKRAEREQLHERGRAVVARYRAGDAVQPGDIDEMADVLEQLLKPGVLR